jgi:secreted Zn-dependent insulinase-like peptidase
MLRVAAARPALQVTSRRCFLALRTQQKLGYSVSLSAHSLQHTLAAAVRIQSPSVQPEELQSRVAAWLQQVRG